MGKAVLMFAGLVVLVGQMYLSQNEQTILANEEQQGGRQAEIVAREIARSGFNAMHSRAMQKARTMEHAPIGAFVEAANGMGGKMLGALQGGSYTAHVFERSASSFGIVAVGVYGKARHRITTYQVRPGVLEVKEKSLLNVTFIESMAGYCSAIYLQRYVPVSSGEGGSETAYEATPPEMIFASGKNRDGAAATYATILHPGEQMNVLLAVDKNCSLRDQHLSWEQHSQYDYHHAALQAKVESLEEMQEGKYAMIEAHPSQFGTWRIGFEDLIQFSDAQHADVKQNGYGGTGWDTAPDGYRHLYDYGDRPDFSDQVIKVRLLPESSQEAIDLLAELEV